MTPTARVTIDISKDAVAHISSICVNAAPDSSILEPASYLFDRFPSANPSPRRHAELQAPVVGFRDAVAPRHRLRGVLIALTFVATAAKLARAEKVARMARIKTRLDRVAARSAVPPLRRLRGVWHVAVFVVRAGRLGRLTRSTVDARQANHAVMAKARWAGAARPLARSAQLTCSPPGWRSDSTTRGLTVTAATVANDTLPSGWDGARAARLQLPTKADETLMVHIEGRCTLYVRDGVPYIALLSDVTDGPPVIRHQGAPLAAPPDVASASAMAPTHASPLPTHASPLLDESGAGSAGDGSGGALVGPRVGQKVGELRSALPDTALPCLVQSTSLTHCPPCLVCTPPPPPIPRPPLLRIRPCPTPPRARQALAEKPLVVRSGIPLDTPKVCDTKPGTLLYVLDAAVGANGHRRIKVALGNAERTRGWVSACTKDGVTPTMLAVGDAFAMDPEITDVDGHAPMTSSAPKIMPPPLEAPVDGASTTDRGSAGSSGGATAPTMAAKVPALSSTKSASPLGMKWRAVAAASCQLSTVACGSSGAAGGSPSERGKATVVESARGARRGATGKTASPEASRGGLGAGTPTGKTTTSGGGSPRASELHRTAGGGGPKVEAKKGVKPSRDTKNKSGRHAAPLTEAILRSLQPASTLLAQAMEWLVEAAEMAAQIDAGPLSLEERIGACFHERGWTAAGLVRQWDANHDVRGQRSILRFQSYSLPAPHHHASPAAQPRRRTSEPSLCRESFPRVSFGRACAPT